MKKDNNKKKILIIKLGAIGDSIWATIIPYAIKLTHPDWQVDYLTHESLITLLKNCNYIDNFIGWKSNYKNKNRQILELSGNFRNEHYDIIFNLSITIRSIILTLLSMPGLIVNKKDFNKSLVENFYFTAKQIIKDLILPDRLYITADKDSAATVKKDLDKYPRPYFVFAPGGSSDYTRQGRIWDIEKWAELSKLLIQNYGGTVFVCGNAAEFEYHQQLAAPNTVILSGKYSLAESNALFSFADLVIAGDTGPIHIASAHNVKTLVILGSTSPDKIKPYGANGFYIEPITGCKYCWKKKCKQLRLGEKYAPCIDSITPRSVLNKIKNDILQTK